MRNVARAFVLTITCVAVVVIITVSGQQPDTLNIRPVKEGLYLINGTGGNVGVRVTSDGVILIDNKFPRNFEAIQERVREVTSEPVKYVINTHHHGDHAGGNVEYIKIAEVIAHQNARDNMIKNEQDGPPRIVFTKETAIHLGDTEVRAYHFGRGHTDGDSFVVFRAARTMHTGDMFQRLGLPFIDVPNSNGSASEFGETLKKAVAGISDVDAVIPGHNPTPVSWDDFVDFSGFYNDVVMKTQAGKAAGQSVDEIVASYELPSEYNDFAAPEGRLRATVQYLFDGE